MGLCCARGDLQVGNADSVNEKYVYILKDVRKIKLQRERSVKYLWVDALVHHEKNEGNLRLFKTQLDIQPYAQQEEQALYERISAISQEYEIKVLASSSLANKVYRALQSEERVTQIYLFCQRDDAAHLLMENFSKIKGFALSRNEVIRLLQGNERKAVLPPRLFLSLEDSLLINHSYLSFESISHGKSRLKGYSDFLVAAAYLFPAQYKEIEEYRLTYPISVCERDRVLEWAFRPTFFWSMVSVLPQVTSDSTILAYIRQPVSDLSACILDNPCTQYPSQVYLVIPVSLLPTTLIVFPSFMRAYTSLGGAEGEQGSGSLMRVRLSGGEGVCVNGGNSLVILHPSLYYVVGEYDRRSRTGVMSAYAIGQNKSRGEEERRLLMKMHYLREVKGRQEGQMIALVWEDINEAVRLGGLLQDSFEDAPVEEKERLMIVVGDIEERRKQRIEAQSMYKGVRSEKERMVALVHLLRVHLADKEIEQFERTERGIDKGVLREYNGMECMYYELYRARLCIIQRREEEALPMLEDILTQLKRDYPSYYSSLPLTHQLMESKIVCMHVLRKEGVRKVFEELAMWMKTCGGKTIVYDEVVAECSPVERTDRRESGGPQVPFAINRNQYSEDINRSPVQTNTRYEGIQQKGLSNEFVAIKKSVPVDQSSVAVHVNDPPSRREVNLDQSPIFVNVEKKENSIKKPLFPDQSSVVVNLKEENQMKKQLYVDQSSVAVNLKEENQMKKPLYVDQSSVAVNLKEEPKKHLYVDQSSVVMNLKEENQMQKKLYVDQSSVVVNLKEEPKKLIAVDQSPINVKIQ